MKVREKTYKRHSWENGKPSWIFIKTAGEHTWKWSNLDVIKNWSGRGRHRNLGPSFLHLNKIRLALVQRNSQRSWWLLRHSRVMQGINVSDRAVHRPKNRTALPVRKLPSLYMSAAGRSVMVRRRWISISFHRRAEAGRWRSWGSPGTNSKPPGHTLSAMRCFRTKMDQGTKNYMWEAPDRNLQEKKNMGVMGVSINGGTPKWMV